MKVFFFWLIFFLVCSCVNEKDSDYGHSEEMEMLFDGFGDASKRIAFDTLFYETGEVWLIKEYKEYPELFRFREFYKTGVLKQKGEQGMVNGVGTQVGTEENFDHSGMKLSERYFEHFSPGNETGGHATRMVITSTFFYDNGAKERVEKMETCYECEECPCGEWKNFDRKGNLLDIKKYEDCKDAVLECQMD